jgi:hypothetical protein
MAGKDFALRATPAAVAVIERLRGTARRSYAAFETELRKQGCRAAGYRLLGAEDGGYSDFCCKRSGGPAGADSCAGRRCGSSRRSRP